MQDAQTSILDLRDAFTWRAAQRLAERKQHQAALAVAREMTAKENPALHWRVFEVQQLMLAGSYEEAVAFAQRVASVHVNAVSPNQRYLICYAQWCGRFALSQGAPDKPIPKYFNPDFRDCPLQDVSMRWRRAFPLFVHPQWKNRGVGWI